MAKEGNKKRLAWAGDGGMGWDGSESRRKMTEGSDTTRLHRPPGSTCLARVARGGSARGGGPIEGTLDAGRGRRDEKRMSTEEGGRDDAVLDAVWPCRWRRGTLSRWVAVAAGCHGMPAAGPPWAKATSSRLFGGGTRLMPVEWYARDRKIRDGVGGTALGRGAAGGVCWKRPGARLGQSTLEHSQRGCG